MFNLNLSAEVMQKLMDDGTLAKILKACTYGKEDKCSKTAMPEGNWTPGGGSVDDSTPKEITAQADTQTPSATVVPTIAQSYTHDDLAKAAITLMDKGMQPELLELLSEFGVQAIPMLPQDSLGQFAVRLREMGANI